MLQGKTALVTGATRHTGLAIAAELLRHGAVVYVNGRNQQDLDRVLAELGPNARPALADLSQPAQISAMMDRVLSDAGHLDILVNNACHLGIGPGFLETSLELLDEVLAVNLKATFLLCQLAARNMKAHGSGSIINISSNTADRPIRNRSTYIASKGASDSITRAMSIELAPFGIRVNTVSPGYIRTTRWEEISDAVRDRRYTNIPIGQEASGEDIGQAVVFFASDMSANVVGAKLTVDGGASTQLFPVDVEA